MKTEEMLHQQLRERILGLSGVTERPNAGIHEHAFFVGRTMFMHIHGAAHCDIRLGTEDQERVLAAGKARRHRWAPDKGYVTSLVRNEADLEPTMELIRMSHDYFAQNHEPKPEANPPINIKPMKKDTIIYWTTTGIVALVMFWSAINFSLNAEMKGAFVHFGLPNWFRVELSVAKILGVLALVIPLVPFRLKEFAYFGFAITIISAVIAHISSGDGVLLGLEPLIFLGFLAVSYRYFHKRRAVTPAGVAPQP